MAGLGLGCSAAAATPNVTIVGVYGLSNAAGQAQVPSPNLWPDARVKEFTKFASNFSLQMAASQTLGVITAGPDLNFGTLLANAGQKVYLAKVTAGGSRCQDWLPTAPSGLLSLYIAAVKAAITQALTDFPAARPTFLNWSILGEQDALNNLLTGPQYKTNQDAVTAGIAAAIGVPRTDIFSIINVALGTMPVPFLGTTAIRAGQFALAGKLVDNDAIVPFDIANSNPHYSSDQCQLVGANGFAVL